jgi:hypothetical protein
VVDLVSACAVSLAGQQRRGWWKQVTAAKPTSIVADNSLSIFHIITDYCPVCTTFYRSVGNLFGMTRCNAQYCTMEVCSVIAEYLKPLYIQWPNNDTCRPISTAFESSSGFSSVIRCIDGIQIPVKAPSADRNSFINRKGCPSINVLTVCDNSMRFTYVYADRACSVHDARVLRISSLGQDIEAGRIFGSSKRKISSTGFTTRRVASTKHKRCHARHDVQNG